MTVRRPVPKAIVALAAAGFLWFVTAASPAVAASPPSEPTGSDPALAPPVTCFKITISGGSGSRPRTVPTLLARVHSRGRAGIPFGRVFQAHRGTDRQVPRAVSSASSTGVSSGGTVVVWLIVAAILAWSAWKLYPAIARWLSGASALGTRHPERQRASRGNRWPRLPTCSSKPARHSATESMPRRSGWHSWR